MTSTDQQQAGFTLLEIVVVVTIIGLIVALVIPNFVTDGGSRELRREATRLASLMELAADEALLQGLEYGVEVSRDGYRFYQLDDESGAWVALTPDDRLFRARRLEQGIHVDLWLEERLMDLESMDRARRRIDDDNDETEGPNPQLLMFSSGDATPFKIALSRDFSEDQVVLAGDLFGRIEIGATDP